MKVRLSACTASVYFALFLSIASVPALAQYNQCVWALNTSASSALSMSGSATISAPNCGVVVDSTSSSAMSLSGSASLTANYVDIAGGYTKTGSAKVSPTPVTDSSMPPAPLSFLVAPTSSSCTYTNVTVSGSGSETLSPGTYCNGITISGSASVSFNPGTYIVMGGGLNVSGSSTLTGTGVTFFLTQGLGYSYGALTVSGSAKLSLKAPTCGSLEGILFYQNPGIGTGKAASSFSGSALSTLEGALYFPTTGLTYSGSGTGNYLTVVANTIALSGSATIPDNYGGLCNAGPLAPPVAVSVSPATSTLYGGQTQQFTASVTNANPSKTGITWSISPSGVGSINSSGLYTAPTTVSAQETVTVTAISQADPTKSASTTLTLMPPVTPTIAWPAPAPITYGTPLSAAQLNATVAAPGTLTYSPAAGTVLSAGTHTLSVTFAPSNPNLYTTWTASVMLTVNKAVPVITWPAPAAIAYGTALSATQLDASANVPGTFVYSPAAGTVLNAGTQTLNAAFTPTDTTDYTTGTAGVTLTVNKAILNITASSPSVSYDSPVPTITPNYSGFVNGDTPSVLSTLPKCTTLYTPTSQVGSAPSTSCSGAAAANYTFTYINGSVNITQASQTIAFTALASPVTYGVVPIALSASASSGLAVSFSATGPCSVASSTLTITGVGTCTVTASQVGNSNYAAAPPVSQSISVGPAPLTVTASSFTVAYGSPVPAVTPIYAGFVNGDSTSVLTTSPTCTTTYTATSPVGSAPTTSCSGAAAANYSFTYANGSVGISQAVPTISVSPSASLITVGQSLASSTLSGGAATSNGSSVSGSFFWTNPTTVPSAGAQMESVTFTPKDTIDYTTATGSVSVTVNQATQCNTNGYSYGRAITIDHTKVPNSDQINFPFLFSTADPTLKATANGGHVSSSAGYDIIFTSDPAGQNPLPYEMEEYDPVNGQVIAWVQIPTVSHIQDTTIYLFYGNANITTSQQNPAAVWDSNYLGVWHVANNGGQLSLADSTSNQNNATNDGASSTTGQIDGGMANNGTSYATVGTLANLEDTLQASGTYSVWVNPSVDADGGIFGENWPGWALAFYGGSFVEVELSAPGIGIGVQTNPGVWSYLTVTVTQVNQADGAQTSYATAYLNGVPVQSAYGNPTIDVQEDLANSATATTYLGLGLAAYGNNQSAVASEDEFRISNIARSPDWIATEYANQSSPSTFYNLSQEGFALSPDSVALYEGQTQQFTASFPGSCSAPISWSISPAGVGTIDQTGFYTAPANIATEQQITITATSGTNSAPAAVTLIPPVAVSVTPGTAAFANNGGEQQQFSATVVNTGNTAVIWSVSPSGAGTIDQTGLYTAPQVITNQQAVTVTATSQFDPTKSGSATITLTPPVLPAPICASNGYSFQRAIVINHNLVPNTDQTNFPFLFNSTDSQLAITANGGHVTNINGYDIMFTADAAGQIPLSFEIEEYDPASGKLIAWVGIPTLSHTSDTVIYLFYGNASISAPQQNAAGVWDSNYIGVWHVANPNGQLSLIDSTSNGDNGTGIGQPEPIAGEIDGGMSSLYGFAALGAPTNLTNLAHGSATFSAWVNPTVYPSGETGYGIVLGKGGYYNNAGWSLGVNSKGQLGFIVYDANNASQCCYPYPVTANLISNGWNYVEATITPDPNTPSQGDVTLYVNGAPGGSGTVTTNNFADDSSFNAYLANNASDVFDQNTFGSFNGSEDEFRISNLARSPDWIAAEYDNQSSPSTFYQLYPENQQGVIPSSTTLYASQAAQLEELSGCGTVAVNWSMPDGSSGTLTAGGLYTAPSSITNQQTVSVTATSQANGSTIGTALVTLDPPLTVGVSPSTQTLDFAPNQTLQFTATLNNAVSNAVTWSISPGNMGSISPAGLYTAPNFSVWSNTVFSSPQTVTITASSVQSPTQSASAILTLVPIVTPAWFPTLYGGFTQQFTATIPVNWSIQPGGIGTIDQNGLYTAPLNVPPYEFNFYLFDILATAQADSNDVEAITVEVLDPNIEPVTPSAVSLIGGQTQSFNVCWPTSATTWGCQNNGQTVANWSISPTTAGSISASGIYSAPALIPVQQTVTVTATDVGNPAISSTGTLTLLPSLTPQSATLYAEEKQQFNLLTNSTETFTWSISPSGTGSISSSGLYSAPPYIASQQTVTVKVTSQANPSISASAVITLLPTQCAGKAYSYVRPIVIDHTKVPSSDQPNFPFYFAVTDPLLASTSNGGHVTSSAGNDIVFSSDPGGLQTLPFELQQYAPATGQIEAWVKVPVLSHSQDTVIYMFYGNSAITAPQQNPPAVWDTNYTAVYQFDDMQNGALLDSTVNAGNAPSNNVQMALGQPDPDAGTFDGATSYAALPTNDFPSYPNANTSVPFFNASFGAWFKTNSSGVILGQIGTLYYGFFGSYTSGLGENPSGYIPALYIDTNGYLRGDLFDLQNAQQIVSATALNDNNWHHVVLTFQTSDISNAVNLDNQPSGIETMYVDGQVIGSQNGLVPEAYAAAYGYYLGTGYTWNWPDTLNGGWFYFNGSLDQVEVSSIARSDGWVQAQYANQSSPATFFTLGAEAGATPSLNPSAVTLYQGQSQQFTVLQTGLCNAGNAVWSMPSSSPGTLSPAGLYSAPKTINTSQTVTVTGTTLGASSTPLNATITLMPPVAVTVAPGVAALPASGTQQFTANVINTNNTGVTWSTNPAGVGSISASGLYAAPATLSGQTVTVIATSLADPTQSASATVTIGTPAPALPGVAVSPLSTILYSGETQQFAATVTNTTNTAVTWSVSPAGVGTIDANGLYTAPATISAQQQIIITATSQANPTATASATLSLAPAQCNTNGYTYVRSITIDHTKVPNSDQINFPFLFSTTDLMLKTTANGGHVASPYGYDIIFTSDPAGQNALPYELEQYDPATGQMIAWVQIPDVSPASDTVIYLFYGNPAISTSQQNPAAVWDSNFGGVWHFGSNDGALSVADSTANGNNGVVSGNSPLTQAEIGYGAALSGYPNYIDAGNNPSVEPTHTGTMSIWVEYNGFTDWWCVPMGNGNETADSNGAMFATYKGGGTSFEVDGDGYENITSDATLKTGQWYYLTGTWDGSTVSFYVNGELAASTVQETDATPAYDLSFGTDGALERADVFLNGNLDEARISNIARSADWIATEYANQSSPSTFFSISAEDEAGITPNSVALYANQSQQFASPGLCSAGVSWSLSSGAQGTLSSSGLYIAPGSITEQQTVTITATSVANPGQSASAVVELMPPVSVAISPTSLTLNQNQNQQFTASVNNSTNTAVTWTMSPAGLGSLDTNGGYIAPSSITTQQTVTVTATSVTDPTKSASAMITLAPSICASTGYDNQRVILIDHTKVPNTDQINFPFLFNTTDPDLKTIDNGGHVANLNGYDIIFSSDPNGNTKLDYEIEQYNPVTGQLVAWIRIPTLSHSSDTVIYVFYGNPAITTSQANPTGVWDSNYQAVYHLGSLSTATAYGVSTGAGVESDSTNYANNASFIDLTPIPGQIDGSTALDGVTSYLEIPSAAFPNYPTGVYENLGIASAQNNTTFNATYSAWFKTSSWGGLLEQTEGVTCLANIFGDCYVHGPEYAGDTWFLVRSSLLDISFDGYLEGKNVGPSTLKYNDNKWHYAVVTFNNGVNELYADGELVASGAGSFGYSSSYAYFVGAEDLTTDNVLFSDYQPWNYLPGQIDEINVSSTARSGDWIQTQFNNQSSPSTFYKFYSPTAVQVAPAAIRLYASQSELFTVPGTCDATINWSLSGGSVGSLTSAGLYTAPSTVSSQQTVTVNATSQSNGTSLGSAQVTLLPAPQPLTLVVSTPSPYQVATTQSFTATLLDPQGNPLAGITVNFMVAGPNEMVGSITTSAAGTASFAYTGANTGTDTVQATASVNGTLLTSNSLTAAWFTPPPAQAPTLTLLPQPSLGRGALMGAFTDGNGDVIEPIEIGTPARTFITPTGATQLQLGINDTYYEINGGEGFVVDVNGSKITVPPTAMPWKWKTGGLNNDYQYGVNDGSSPKIAASSLTAGQLVTIAYQSGTISTNYPVSAPVNANGDPNSITGTQISNGAYFPTLYTTGTAYPQNQPINVFATVVDASGVPIANTTVALTITGANPGQYQATTDATGAASFLYTGQYAGDDSLQAVATLTGQGTLESSQATIDWINYPTPPPVGSLSLNEIATDVNVQWFSAIASDASGNLLPNENVGFYISGVDNAQASVGTNNIGEALYSYYHTQAGSYKVIAVDSVDRNVIVTQPYTSTWSIPNGPTSSSGTIIVGITANSSVTIPNPLQLTGTVTDNSGLTPTLAWTQVSGPGTVAFKSSDQTSTTATFSQVGTYVLQLAANDRVNSGWAQITVNVLAPSIASQAQGWIGSPTYGATVTGVVPITLAAGVSLASGTLSYAPAENPNNTTVLNENVSGSGQIGSLDTTALANGSYLIQMQGQDTSGDSQYSLVLVTVTGDYKPGRVTTTVTDLVVPATGLPIQIQRIYDSLNAGTSGDFGYGWNLGINTQLTVDNSGNVTFTLGGQRKTFYLTPTYGGWLFPYYFPSYTPQPGAFGTLTDTGSGCALDLLVPDGSIWDCYGSSGQFTPSGYIYTDPSGTQYTMSAGGQLQSVTDKNGNGLTIGPNGITSTTGLNVPFVRDSQNRITQITDPAGNVYTYGYDANGNLASVTYPLAQSNQVCAGATTPNTGQYTYYSGHYYESGTDGNCNPLPLTTYYDAGEMDASGNYSVAGKLQSVTDALGETTSYAYNLATNTTVVTYPADAQGKIATETVIYDANGDVLSYKNPLSYTTTYTYDANHNRISETDPLGNTTTYTYDANGNRTSITYPKTATSKNTTSYTNYNQYSQATSFTDELGNVRTYTYDANFNPGSVTDSLGTLASFIFNANGQPMASAAGYDIAAQPGMASQYTYDANGNLASTTDALGRTSSSTYNALGQKITSTVPLPGSNTGGPASTTTYQYDTSGNLLQTTAPLGDVTTSQYDANNNRISTTDARGNITKYQYDALSRLIETDYPDGNKITSTYDFRNNIIDSTDQSGNVTHHTYDLAGKLLSVTAGYGTSSASTTTYSYYPDGRKQSDTDPLGHVTTYFYDAAGRLITVTNAAGSTHFGYDDAGNQISVTDPNGHTTTTQYDARKRAIKTVFSDGTSTSTSYDGVGNVISSTDQALNVVQNTYDPANQLISTTYLNSPNAPNNVASYAYNSDGNQSGMTDENGHTTSSAYDVLSRLTSTTLPDGSLTESRQYDAAGNLVSLTHFNGKTTTYTYDNLNRLIQRTPDPSLNEPTVSFTYTANGQRQTMTDGSGTTQYTYDAQNRLTAKATPEGTLSYTYDAAGNVATVISSNANGVSLSYTYDNVGRLSTVADNRLAGSNTTTYSYDANSNLVTATLPNGLKSTFAYDSLNRLTSVASPVSSYSYQLGVVGNRTAVTEGNGRTVNWVYDGVYRLTNESIANDPSQVNGAVSYSLDPVGNRKRETTTIGGLDPGTFNYNADDELTPDGYDLNGNTIATGSKTFAYDSENELISMNGGAVTLVYDGDGNRVAKTIGGVTTYYLVDDLNPTGLPQVVEELSSAGVVERQYSYGLHLISQQQMVNTVWTPSFYESDGEGSVRQLTDITGKVTDTYEYDAFGNALQTSGSTPNVYLYRGEQSDSDLGLYYLRARYYNPLTGRFLSVDSEAGSGQRRYEYAGADPVNGMDPTGDFNIGETAVYTLFPEREPFIQVAFPWCGIPGIGKYLYGCGAPSGPPSSPAGPPPPPPPPCKKCFNTQAFADYLDGHAALLESTPTSYHPSKGHTYCARIVREALHAGGAVVPNGDAYTFANTLPAAGFEQVGPTIPYPVSRAQYAQHGGRIGDVTVFGKAPKHDYGHVEGYTGKSGSGWTSYWQQSYWTPYPASPAGSAQIFRSKCPCGQ